MSPLTDLSDRVKGDCSLGVLFFLWMEGKDGIDLIDFGVQVHVARMTNEPPTSVRGIDIFSLVF